MSKVLKVSSMKCPLQYLKKNLSSEVDVLHAINIKVLILIF